MEINKTQDSPYYNPYVNEYLSGSDRFRERRLDSIIAKKWDSDMHDWENKFIDQYFYDGDGKLTYMYTNDTFTAGDWYHVAGTYDGSHIHLYVNGKHQGSSNGQSGDINYPDNTDFIIGAYMFFRTA